MKEIMILGTFHFDSIHNRDLFHQKMDIQSLKRQEELAEVLDCLKRFHPTKIALEVKKTRNDELNQQYTDFLSGKAETEENEVDQIGFQLAKLLGHKKVYGVDWNEALPYVPSIFQWLSENSCPMWDEILPELEKSNEKDQEHLEKATLKEHFIYLNSAARIQKDHSNYIKQALMGGDKAIGAQWVAQYWYYRNFLIYKNTAEIFSSEQDKVFLLIGAGHLHLLSQFFTESGLFHVVNVAEIFSNRE